METANVDMQMEAYAGKLSVKPPKELLPIPALIRAVSEDSLPE